MKRPSLPLVLFSCLVASLLLVPQGPAFAQVANSGLSGTVRDDTGAILPGATVEIVNSETGLSRTAVTNARGRFNAPNLPPGIYDVSVTMQGFGTLRRTGIRLSVGEEASLTLQMSVQLTEEIAVETEQPLIVTTSGSTGTLIDTEQITSLPLNGRSYLELATLTPGVQFDDEGGVGTSTGYGKKLSVHGSRYTSNLFTLDGTSLNDQFSQAGSASGNVLGVEAVREFRVLTNSFSAEYGRHTGGVINAVTRSGTNEFHGSVFEFHRNDALDAQNYFDDPTNLPDLTRNQFGAALGGPIAKNKTFFFATFEGLREDRGQTQFFNVPSNELRNRTDLSPLTAPYIRSYPAPNGPNFNADRAEYSRVSTRTTDENYAMLRLDHQFSSTSRIFARYTFNKAEVIDPNRVTTFLTTRTKLQYGTLEHNMNRGASFFNRLQVGLTKSDLDGFDTFIDNVDVPFTTFTSYDGIGAITVPGISGWGASTTNPKSHRFQNISVSDTVTWLSGDHSVKVGASVEFLRYDLTSAFTSFGDWDYDTIDDWVHNIPSGFAAMLPGSDFNRILNQKVFGFFVQDDIQVTPSFTLNVGIRYEPTSAVTEAQGRLAQLLDFGSPTATLNDTTVLDKLFEPPAGKTFAPRVGFAWDVNGDGKMAIRGGAGIFYDLITINVPFVQNTAVRVPPFINRGNITDSGGPIDFPNAYNTQTARLAAQSALEGTQYDLDQPTMYKWNLNIQRDLGAGIAAEIGYSGNHADHLMRMDFTNERIHALNDEGRLALVTNNLIQPNFGRMRYRVSNGSSDYHGLTVGLTRHSTNLNIQLSYTYSKAIDDGTSSIGGNDFSNESGGSRYTGLIDRGLAAFDLRHNFSGNVNWQVPFGKDGGGLSALVRDWNVGLVVRARSGYPTSAFIGFDQGRQRWTHRYPDLAPGRSNNPVNGGSLEQRVAQYFDPTAFELQPRGIIGNLGRNTLIGPGLFTIDLMLERRFPLGGERFLQFRAEAYNLLNRVNLGMPNTNIFNSNGTIRADAGRITSTSTTARQVQLGVKLIF